MSFSLWKPPPRRHFQIFSKIPFTVFRPIAKLSPDSYFWDGRRGTRNDGWVQKLPEAAVGISRMPRVREKGDLLSPFFGLCFWLVLFCPQLGCAFIFILCLQKDTSTQRVWAALDIHGAGDDKEGKWVSAPGLLASLRRFSLLSPTCLLDPCMRRGLQLSTSQMPPLSPPSPSSSPWMESLMDQKPGLIPDASYLLPDSV